MRSIWILNDADVNPLMGPNQSRLVREYLRAKGFITRIEDSLNGIVARVQHDDIVFAIGWDARILDIKGLIEKVAIEREAKLRKTSIEEITDVKIPLVKLVALLPWGQGQGEKPGFEERILCALDLALVRSSTERTLLLEQYQNFNGDDCRVVGGFEIMFDVLNVCPKVSWEARENRIVFPYQETSGNGFDELSALVADYSARYPADKLKMVSLFGRIPTREKYLAEVARAKVIFSGRMNGWPTELFDASFLGVYPLTPNGGIFKETVPDACRYTSPGNRVDFLHTLLRKPFAYLGLSSSLNQDSLSDLLKARDGTRS